MDHILCLRSNQSDLYYPNNTPYHFKIFLNKPLFLEGDWQIALLDFYSEEKISVSKKNRHELYIFCDACMGVNISNNQFSLLRRIFPTPDKTWNYIFSTPVYYLPVKKNEIRELEFHIKDENGQDATFLKQPLSCTVHFKPYKHVN